MLGLITLNDTSPKHLRTFLGQKMPSVVYHRERTRVTVKRLPLTKFFGDFRRKPKAWPSSRHHSIGGLPLWLCSTPLSSSLFPIPFWNALSESDSMGSSAVYRVNHLTKPPLRMMSSLLMLPLPGGSPAKPSQRFLLPEWRHQPLCPQRVLHFQQLH